MRRSVAAPASGPTSHVRHVSPPPERRCPVLARLTVSQDGLASAHVHAHTSMRTRAAALSHARWKESPIITGAPNRELIRAGLDAAQI